MEATGVGERGRNVEKGRGKSVVCVFCLYKYYIIFLLTIYNIPFDFIYIIFIILNNFLIIIVISGLDLVIQLMTSKYKQYY